jgi:hypothetical protein
MIPVSLARRGNTFAISTTFTRELHTHVSSITLCSNSLQTASIRARFGAPPTPPRIRLRFVPSSEHDSYGWPAAVTIVAQGRPSGPYFTHATHPIWWIMTECAAIVLPLGWAANTGKPRHSAERVAHCLEPPR